MHHLGKVNHSWLARNKLFNMLFNHYTVLFVVWYTCTCTNQYIFHLPTDCGSEKRSAKPRPAVGTCSAASNPIHPLHVPSMPFSVKFPYIMFSYTVNEQQIKSKVRTWESKTKVTFKQDIGECLVNDYLGMTGFENSVPSYVHVALSICANIILVHVCAHIHISECHISLLPYFVLFYVLSSWNEKIWKSNVMSSERKQNVLWSEWKSDSMHKQRSMNFLYSF